MNNSNHSNRLNHLAIIMDGNGRWAKNNNLERIFGHQAGLKNIQNIAEYSVKNNIQYLTLFAFSTENYALDKYRAFIIDNNLIFQCIGDISILPKQIKEKILDLENETKHNCKMTLIIAFNYGGRNDIINATKNILQQIKDGILQSSDLNETLFQNYLYTSNIPDPDLLIRTGGQKRLSNFLLWQLSYTELFFCDDHWPDFDEQKLAEVLKNYFLRKRNFGKI